jgi:hypothetical protein
LRAHGHDVVAPDLPADESAGLTEYAGIVIEVTDDRFFPPDSSVGWWPSG